MSTRLILLLLFSAVASLYLSSDLTDAWQVHAGVMGLGFMQVLAFVFVSRSRNRSDDRYHALAAVASNSVWYLTFNSVFFYSLFTTMRPENGSIPYELLLPFLIGSIGGGMCAAYYSQKIERLLELHAGTKVKGENLETQTLRQLIVGQLKEIHRHWWLYVGLGAIVLTFVIIADSPSIVLGFVILAYGQNIAFALGSRARNRNSALYIVFTSLLGTLALFFVWRILIIEGMPLELFAPYTAATVLGSISGARVSMIIERFFGIEPDDHVYTISKEIVALRKKRENTLWIIVCSVGVIAMIATPFATTISVVELLLVLCAAFLNSGVHILASRASNRNHMMYNFVTRLFWGFGWFFLTAIAVHYEMSYTILVPYMLGSILGNLFGFKCAMFAEKKLSAIMDIEPEKKPA